MFRPLLLGALLAGAAGGPATAAAQATDAAIVGLVRDTAGAPLAGAQVEARHAGTGFTATVEAGAGGRFALVQLPLGGPWRVVARRIGHRPAVREVTALRLGSHVTLDLTLTPAAVTLDELQVVADTARERRALRLGGNTRIDEAQLEAIPAVNRSFTDLAQLAPTVGPQLAIGGQRFTATDFRVDGVLARNGLRAGEYAGGPYSYSLEAIREFEVNANVYDVAQGRGGGGTISAATRAGGNAWTGSVFAYHRDVGLSAPTDFLGRPRSDRPFTTTQWGGSVGGPLVRDRLQLFAALDRQDGSEPLQIALLRTPQDEMNLGISADSLARLEHILADLYGATGRQSGTFLRAPDVTTALVRLDWAASAAHRVSLRYNHSDFRNPLGGGVDQPITLFEARSGFRSFEHQALASLQSRGQSGMQNDLSLAVNTSARRLVAVTDLPRGFVRVRSTLPDGATGDVRVQFGGNRLAPDASDEAQFQLQDRLVVPRGELLLSFGTDNVLTRLRTLIAVEQGGLFEFESLADLEARRAFRYSRTVPLEGVSPQTSQSVLDLGLYAQADWRRGDWLLSAGLRWDATAFLTAAARNPLVDSLLGLRTDTKPADWLTLQPRAQAVWLPRSGDVVRVGGGLFTSLPPYYVQHNTLLHTGLALADVLYTGAAVPTPDFPGYRADPGAVPGVIPPAAAIPFVNVVSPDWRLPTTWKASAAYERPLARWLRVSASLLASWTRGNYHYADRNLREAPAFTLANEGGRGVFVPAATIDARGRTNVRNALAEPRLGRVLELTSPGRGRDVTAILEATATWGNGGFATVSYAWSDARDNSSFGCCLARTATTFTPIASDPRDLTGSWGSADLAVRHKVVVAGGTPPVHGFRLSGRYVGSTGRPFSLVVNGDINGDESATNDLAFLFDPDDPATPPEVAEGMRRLLANEESVARDYVRANLGRLAGRNAIVAPWTARLDVRLTKEFRTWAGQSVELTVDVFNFLNLLDRDWGGQNLLPAGISAQNPVLQRQALLDVVGFDQAARRYVYSVNENAGVLQRGGDPYQVQLGARYRF